MLAHLDPPLTQQPYGEVTMSVENLSDYEYARKRFSYEPDTGIVRWNWAGPEFFRSEVSCKMWNARFAGTVAGTRCTSGHINALFRGKKKKLHRIIWLWVNGCWPEYIDHINGKPDDNRIANLRDVDRSENYRNFPKRFDNTSGHVGVSWYKSRSMWLVRINVNGREKNLGYYTDLSDAVEARKLAEAKYGYHENHGRG